MKRRGQLASRCTLFVMLTLADTVSTTPELPLLIVVFVLGFILGRVSRL